MPGKRRLFLISGSQTPEGYLHHCIEPLQEFLADVDSVVFVPYALQEHDWYEHLAAEFFRNCVGKELVSVHRARDKRAAIREAESVFIGGGNTFVLLKALEDHDLPQSIRDRVYEGMPYIGSSAGANVACPTIQTTNDMPVVQPQCFKALNLVTFNLNPHYYDTPEDSPHRGESRDERIGEFQQYNETPVVALYEDSMLQITGTEVSVLGGQGAKVFRPRKEAVRVEVGSRLDELL